MVKQKDEEILVDVRNVSKKFCRNLKRSLWYGVKDLSSNLLGIKQDKSVMRKDEFWAVKDVSFQLRRGECLGLIGHNGAGKSTLLKMLNGLIRPDEGEIRMRGKIGALIELGAGFNPILTGKENVYINGQVLGFSKKEIDKKFDAIVDFAEIGEFIDTPVQNYSSGMKVRLGFAVAAQMEPDVLIIDEVLAVGDVGFKSKCFNAIHKLTNTSAVIFVSHSMPQVSRICTDAILMKKGHVKLKKGNNEVSQVINKYYQLPQFNLQEEFKDELIELVEMKVNSRSNYNISVQRNSKLSFEIDIRLKQEVNFSCQLAFVDQDFKNILLIDSLNDGKNLGGKDRVKILIDLERLILNNGKYNLSLYLFETKNNKAERWLYRNRSAKTVTVESTSLLLSGSCTDNASWKIQ